MTGSTDTSLWTVYKKGVRNYCGNVLPDGVISIYVLLSFLSDYFHSLSDGLLICVKAW